MEFKLIQQYIITREDVLGELARHELSPTPKRSEAEILEAFKIASHIGRNWLRTIDGKPIPRAELSQLIELIKQGSRTILLVDRPGSGKTCLLLDLADEIEKSGSSWGLLFIKGDWFVRADSEKDLVAQGLPEDIVGQCARLAGFRQVVIILDSLDVLSLSRQHSALKVFLGLMDRLEKINNVTVVAACRSFDLQYDPLLKGRSWQNTIDLKPLDFKSVVKPFLQAWGVNLSNISPELQTLLQLPQNLRLYEKLAKIAPLLHPTSTYELYNSFIEEVVAKNPLLGDKTLVALENMADYLMQQRSQSCSKEVFKGSEEIVRHLISQEVLWEKSPGVLAFSHQTLADCFLVRASLANNTTLTQFILARPQLPFIRPAVRVFFFYLRARQPDTFRKQVWQVLSNDKVAYHIKRLICESFAEISPVDEDWRLLYKIFQNYPDLFRRLLGRAEVDAWFDIFKRYWLKEVQTLQNREDWLRQFCWKLGVWVNRYPAEVIALWKEAIATPWLDRENLIGIICSGLDNFKAWDTKGIRELLEMLVEHSEREQDSLGRPISQWVQATNSGDDLLWKYITMNVLPESVSRRDLRNKLRCESYRFYQDNFLTERLSQSDVLLTSVLDNIERWSVESAFEYEKNKLRERFLWNTSWELKHNRQYVHPVDDLSTLFDNLESALKHRARQNDTWWQANEPHLQVTQEQAIRYCIIQAYKENIEANILGIEAQLQDKELFCCSELGYELGELMQIAYPYILRQASSEDPERFLLLFACLIQENLHQDYICAVIEGLASHLRYRFGNLKPNHPWKPVEPLPDGEVIATALLNWLKRYPFIWEKAWTVTQALEACCDVLSDFESAERLTLLLFWLRAKYPSDEKFLNPNDVELLSRAINSTRGIAAMCAMRLCNRLLENEQSLPELLPLLLRHFACDPEIHVRIPVLQQLPFLTYKQPDLGWQLLADVFQEPQPRLWEYTERCLYYQYRDRFALVALYLNRLWQEGMKDAGDIWGRLSTLACLAGHISQEQLFNTLTAANADAWKGATQVFGANLNLSEHRAICYSGLIATLRHGKLSNEVVSEIENCFAKEANREIIQRELALAFLDILPTFTEKYEIHNFLEWLSYESRRNPLSALDVAEVLVEKLEIKMQARQIWRTQPLIAALNEILREADETDEPELIQRAISLQDRFLKLDIPGIEELLTKAGQN
jgi:ATPase family associated with various cellular activities (AAA)